MRALDPAHSFIVQAPAGSGKTELLIQRHLALLALVEAPEEIVAITFTRKAAGEMRDRVLQALQMASGPSPAEDHRRKTWELARAVVHRDAQMGWGLAATPSRLRIQTIDSLCASLTRQMPVLSGFGAPPRPVENAEHLHRDAARRTLAQLDEGGSLTSFIGRALMHLDNDVMKAEELLAQMLARRDQWLRHVADRHSPRLRRETLEAALADLTLDALEALRELMPPDLQVELIELGRYAADNLAQAASGSDIVALLELRALPGTGLEDLSTWCGIARLLLTSRGVVRKVSGVNAAIGFPAGGTGMNEVERDAGGNSSVASRYYSNRSRNTRDSSMHYTLPARCRQGAIATHNGRRWRHSRVYYRRPSSNSNCCSESAARWTSPPWPRQRCAHSVPRMSRRTWR